MRTCPRCNGALATAPAKAALAGILGQPTVELDVCGNCGGAFLDKNEFGWLTGDMTVDHLANEPHDDASPGSKCPACASTMERRRERGLAFESCGSCGGLWFEGKEIERLI